MTTTIIGNLTKAPEIKFLDSGMAVATFSVAENSLRGKEEYVSYFDCTAWGSLAENITRLEKGTRVVVVGNLRQDRFEKDGAKREKIQLIANAVGVDLRFATAQVTKTTSPAAKANSTEDSF